METTKYLDLDTIKKIETNVLDYIADICKRNGINYTLWYGTLLGAVRHKGFIPWDDDIDIALERDDYERLLKCIKEDGHPQYRLMEAGMGKYYQPFAKVIDANTRLISEGGDEMHDGRGVSVDIFPIDKYPESKPAIIRRYNLYIYLLCISAYTSAPKGRKLGILSGLPWLFAKAVGSKFWLHRTEHIIRKCNRQPADKIWNAPGPEIYPKDLFESYTEIEFEGRKYQTITAYIKFLEIMYGNFMELPPIDKRATHQIKAISLK